MRVTAIGVCVVAAVLALAGCGSGTVSGGGGGGSSNTGGGSAAGGSAAGGSATGGGSAAGGTAAGGSAQGGGSGAAGGGAGGGSTAAGGGSAAAGGGSTAAGGGSTAAGGGSTAAGGGSAAGGSSGGGSTSAGGGSAAGGGASTGGGGASNSTTFSALHTYYVSPTGDDGNSGTSPTSAWKTPNHSVNCGDVIIAAAGNYNDNQFGTNNWGTVSSCPSTHGGIDGSGGVYFAVLLCAGPDVGSCKVNGGDVEAFRVDASNWAVEGFEATQAPTASQGGFAVGCYTATSETNTTLHHIAFINDIANGGDAAGFGSFSWTNPGGVDQVAMVGVIAYNAAPSQGGVICGSGISIIPTNGPDTSAGTHVFVAGAFSYKNINAFAGAGCNTDGEGLIFDSWGIPAYKYQAVVEQNVFWANGGPGFEAFPQGNGTSDDAAKIVVFNNTSYGNFQDPKHVGSGELMLNQVYPSSAGYAFKDNIFEATMASSAGGTVYGAAIACTNDCPASVLTVEGNFIWNNHSPTTNAAGGRNTTAWYSGMDQGANFPWGTIAFSNPGLANPGALPMTAPDCTGHANTTACMTAAGVPAAVGTSGAAAGKGYQAPGACAADALYPAWLKGVVYLTVNGSTVTENNTGLITKPCNL